MRRGWVYVVEGGGAVKIGVTRDPRGRLAQLQTGSPKPLRMAYSTQVPGDAYGVEAEAHAMLWRYRLQGEWFQVPVDVAVAAVHGAAARLIEEKSGARGEGKSFSAVASGLIAAACMGPAWVLQVLAQGPVATVTMIGSAVVLLTWFARQNGVRPFRPASCASAILGGTVGSASLGIIASLAWR